MSGGVDSTVTACLLRAQGYQVMGVTMQVWDGSVPLPDTGRSGCFGPGEVRELEAIRALARQLGFEHVTLNLAQQYARSVLDYFRAEYLRGKTPNPCVVCNHTMKFGALLDAARAQGITFDYFATGHYARIGFDAARGRYLLRRGIDPTKDQSYFLSQLTQEQLMMLQLNQSLPQLPPLQSLLDICMTASQSLVRAHPMDSAFPCARMRHQPIRLQKNRYRFG